MLYNLSKLNENYRKGKCNPWRMTHFDMYVRCKLLYLGLYFYWTMLDRDGKSSAYLSVRDIEVS